MTSTTTRSSSALAGDVIRVAWRCYTRHLAAIVALSLVGSVQRAALQFWEAQLPGWVGVSLELLVLAARIALAVLVFRWIVLADDQLRDVSFDEGLHRVRRYARRHWRALGLQALLIGAAFAVFDLVPDLVIAPRVQESAQATYWAILLAVKNPTVIAFTLIWEIALLRQALRLGAAGAPATAEPVAGAPA